VFDHSTNKHDEESSFAEAYKSQILNPSDEDEERSIIPKIIGIVVLIALISGLSIFGYQYINQQKQEESSEEPDLPPPSMMIDHIEELDEPTPNPSPKLPLSHKADREVKGESVTEIADKVKIELSKELDQAKSTQTTTEEVKLSVSKQKGEDTYLEQLAELSKEIDGEVQ